MLGLVPSDAYPAGGPWFFKYRFLCSREAETKWYIAEALVSACLLDYFRPCGSWLNDCSKECCSESGLEGTLNAA